MVIREYNLQTSRAGARGYTVVSVETCASLEKWNYRQNGYARNLALYRYNKKQTTNALLSGVRSAINAGLNNGDGVLTLKFKKSTWSLTIYKNKGFWINGFKKTKGAIDTIVSYMVSRHMGKVDYDEAEKLFLGIKDTDLVIAETIINKLKYSFYNEDGEVETMLNIERTGKDSVSIELNEGLWVSMKDSPFKSFMRACEKNKNKWYAISPEELYLTCTGKALSNSNVKLMHAFLEQNRHSTLVEKKSMELIEGLANRWPDRIKNIDVVKNNRNDEEEIFKGMFIKGTKLDWMVYSVQHAAHRNGTQDVSTYCVVSNKNFTIREADEDNGITEQVISIDGVNVSPRGWPADFEPEGYTLYGPICIDQTQTDVSLGDQYASRALALLNDKATLDMVSTLSTYRNYEVKYRMDFDALSKLSIK